MFLWMDLLEKEDVSLVLKEFKCRSGKKHFIRFLCVVLRSNGIPIPEQLRRSSIPRCDFRACEVCFFLFGQRIQSCFVGRKSVLLSQSFHVDCCLTAKRCKYRSSAGSRFCVSARSLRRTMRSIVMPRHKFDSEWKNRKCVAICVPSVKYYFVTTLI